MRYLCAPSPFRDCLPAPAVAAAMARGIRRAEPDAEIVITPLADGGDGTVAALHAAWGGTLCPVNVLDAIGRVVEAPVLLSEDGDTAVVEMATASGLSLLAPGERSPWASSTYGTGQLILAALELGATTILVGAGGSATLDCGAGALTALGAVFRDAQGQPLHPVPAELIRCREVDTDALDGRLAATNITVLSDVDLTLGAAAPIFAAQKGIEPDEWPGYQDLLNVLARGTDLLSVARGGAGGGLAAGLACWAGASLRGGAEFVCSITGIDERIRTFADLVLCGEGRFDRSSLAGKGTGLLVQLAAVAGLPCWVFAGGVEEAVRSRLGPDTKVIELPSGDERPFVPSGDVAAALIEDAAAMAVASLVPQA